MSPLIPCLFYCLNYLYLVIDHGLSWFGRWWKKYFFICPGQAQLCQLWFKYLLTLLLLMVNHLPMCFFVLFFNLNYLWVIAISLFNERFCTFIFLNQALQFTPRLKGVLSRVLPILGNVRDVHRPIFANGNMHALPILFF